MQTAFILQVLTGGISTTGRSLSLGKCYPTVVYFGMIEIIVILKALRGKLLDCLTGFKCSS